MQCLARLKPDEVLAIARRFFFHLRRIHELARLFAGQDHFVEASGLGIRRRERVEQDRFLRLALVARHLGAPNASATNNPMCGMYE